MLTAKAFYRGPIDSSFGARTRQAVMAFHKDQELPRTWDWQAVDWLRLAAYVDPDIPDRPAEPNRMEVDIGKQVAYLVENGLVSAIVPISSGNGALFSKGDDDETLIRAYTPRGDFTFARHINGLRISYLGILYKPWYFRGGYAIHGSPSVPSYPASHGCIRIPNWEVDWMDGHLAVGMPVHVFS
jgi:lipoprotein-anchoring transpeptidase ErfK/SrfK